MNANKKHYYSIIVLLLYSYIGFSQTFTDNGFNFSVLSTNPNQVAITGGSNLPSNLTIPSTATDENGTIYTVTVIGTDAFRLRGFARSLTTVTLPNTITTIKSSAFNSNVGITSITFPKSLTIIEQAAFFNTGLREIIALGDAPAQIEPNSLSDRTVIELTVPNGKITEYEVADWTGFKSINGEVSLKSVFFANNNKYIITSKTPNNLMFNGLENSADNIVIPATITERNFTFQVTEITGKILQRENFSSITIPNTIVKINESSFRFSEIEEFTSLAVQPPLLERGVLARRPTIKLTVPLGSEEAYRENGWNNFFSINNIPSIGIRFTVDNLNYQIIGNTPNSVAFTGGTTTGVLTIPESVSFNGFTFKVTEIGSKAFQNQNFTRVVIPNTIVKINEDSFRFSEIEEFTSLAVQPPLLERGVLARRPTIKLTVPLGSEEAYRENGWNNFLSINNIPSIGVRFTVDDLNYQIIGNTPNSVACTGGTVTDVLTIPESVSFNSFTFKVTEIGARAFVNQGFKKVVVPSTITAFKRGAFEFSEINEVVSLSATPPILERENFKNRQNTNLKVPLGSIETYKNNGWDNFKFTTHIGLELAPKIFLQGANTSNETLMRDNLRVSGVLPTTSPYLDALTVNATIFNTEGENAIVDWVFVELRNATNSSEVLASTSALLQRNGNIVALDGVSPLSIPVNDGNYFVAITHRNHLSIRTLNTIALSKSVTSLNFTLNASLLKGGQNAIVNLSNGKIAMIAGDVNTNGNIQVSDLNTLALELGKSGYSNSDLNMNGQVQIDDINNLLTPNLGKGEQ